MQNSPPWNGHTPRKRVPWNVASIAVSVAIAVVGHFLLGTAELGERINIIGAAVFAILALVIFELHERSQLSRVLGVLEDARADPWLVAQLEQIVQDYSKIRSMSDSLFLARAQKQLQSAVAEISQSADGQVNVAALQESVFTIELVDHCHKTMAAISIHDEQWWSSSFGRQYLDRHVTALERKVKIRRLFVLPAEKSSWPSILTEMNKQAAIGIDVRAIADVDLVAGQNIDMVIYDGTYVRTGIPGEPRTARLSRNPDDLHDAVEAFEDAWVRAAPPDEFVALPSGGGS